MPDKKKREKDAVIDVEKNNVSENAMEIKAKGQSALILVIYIYYLS